MFLILSTLQARNFITYQEIINNYMNNGVFCMRWLLCTVVKLGEVCAREAAAALAIKNLYVSLIPLL